MRDCFACCDHCPDDCQDPHAAPCVECQAGTTRRKNEAVHDLGLGDKIEHDLMPGFVMAIEGLKSCETDGTRPEPHMQYRIHDPEGNEDWLCAYDVHKAGEPE